MNQSQWLTSWSSLLAICLLAGCSHGNTIAKVPHATRGKMSIVGYEVIQTRGPNQETHAARHERLLKAGRVPLTHHYGHNYPAGHHNSARNAGEIAPPAAVRRNPARWSRSKSTQPAVMQENSRRYEPMPKEVIF